MNYGTSGGNVTVAASNSCGTSAASSLSVTVNSTPSMPGSIVGSTSVCPNSSGNSYSVSSVSGATSYTWSVPSGATITSGQGTSGIVVNFGSNAGNVTVTASNSCGTSSANSLSVSLSGAAPATPGTIAGSASVCVGELVVYSIDIVNGATNYNWTVPAGSSINSGQGSTSISMLAGSTSGNITVNASSSCGTSDNSVKSITVNAAPSAPLTSVSNGCGESVISASGSNLLWSTGASSASITVPQGSYTVTQTVNGCTSDPALISADPAQVPSAPSTDVTNSCGLSTLSASGSNLLWSTGETTSSVVVTTSGTFTVTQTVNGCTSPSSSVSSSPLLIPTVTFSEMDDVCINDEPFNLSAASPTGGTYSGQGVASNAFDPEMAGYGTHIITYEYTASNGCSNSSHQTITVGCASVGIEELDALSVYPNPSFGIVMITGIEVKDYQRIEIVDQMGRVVLDKEVESSTMELDLSALASGQYIIRLEGMNQVILKKVQLIQE